MFGFGSGKSAYPSITAATNVKKPSKKESPSSAAAKNDTPSSPDSLEPAIDGPPSPERIRAYTEQMKRSSIFGNNLRTNTFSSASSSSRSRESMVPSADNLSLSRRSSNRSNTSSMPSVRSERPESVAIFGSIFSRAGRKGRRDTDAGLNRSSSSLAISTLEESASEEGPARERYYGKGRSSRRKQLISGPYNFQHVTHTRQEHLPNLERASRMQLASEFSAVRDSQLPTHGELKGIRAEDLHFENFSSEALNDVSGHAAPAPKSPKSPRQRSVLRKSITPQPQRMINYAKSHDNLRSAPPQPPRSPLSHACPFAPPARTSSRTASILFDTFDPLATTTIERPYTSSGFRRPAPFSLPSPPPPPSSWTEHQELSSTRPLSHAMTTPGDEAWPLTASLTGNFELADVKEEDEDVGSRKSRVSVASSELRMSQSVPALRRLSYEQANDMLENRMSRSPSGETVVPHKTPLSPGCQIVHDSWEDDIDYCYEHEVEADCDYQWDRCSVEEERVRVTDEASQAEPQQPILELHLQNEERVYHGHFRPSLLTPTPFDLPELSPMSNASSTISSHPQTPSNFLRPSHGRSPSHASSFKESHGFHLSPTLLIPADFQLQMAQDEIYHEQYNTLPSSTSIFVQDSYQHSISPIDEGTSSTASYRSSNFSRGSARSSSSTRMSGVNSRGSQDSVMLLGRTGNLSEDHRSIGSASSLPDLIPSTVRQSVIDFSTTVAALRIPEGNIDAAPAPQVAGPAPTLASLQHRRNKSLVLDGLRKGVNHFPPASSQTDECSNFNGILSPVAESSLDSPSNGKGQGNVHGRKSSAPTVSSVKEFKGRARASTATAKLPGGKKRGSYMLFPQI